MDKQLKDKAIKFKWKDYVLIADRVLYFNDVYENWCITTELVSYKDKQVIVKAIIYPEWPQGRYFTWYSQAIEWDWYINKTSALENAETSAVGRALGLMWIGVIDSIASIDEINKAKNTESMQSQIDNIKLLKTKIIEMWYKTKEEAESFLKTLWHDVDLANIENSKALEIINKIW